MPRKTGSRTGARSAASSAETWTWLFRWFQRARGPDARQTLVRSAPSPRKRSAAGNGNTIVPSPRRKRVYARLQRARAGGGHGPRGRLRALTVKETIIGEKGQPTAAVGQSAGIGATQMPTVRKTKAGGPGPPAAQV